MTHNERTEGPDNVEEEIERVEKQREIVKTIDSKTKELRKLPNWKAPGLDGLNGFWLKCMTTIWGKIATHLQAILPSHKTPKWSVMGSTSLTIEDQTIGAEVSNFTPITCLPLVLFLKKCFNS